MPPSPNLQQQIYLNVGTGLPPQEIPTTAVAPPLCHIPHKNWSTLPEAENYAAVERWARVMHDGTFVVGFHLHIPHKEWATPPEVDNYREIERWADDVRVNGYTLPLHVPHKDWARAERTGPQEADNYRYLERWSTLWAGYPGKAGVGQPPIYPNLQQQIYLNVT